MVAGFIAGCESGDYGHALKLGTVCGGATAFSDGLADKLTIARLMSECFCYCAKNNGRPLVARFHVKIMPQHYVPYV